MTVGDNMLTLPVSISIEPCDTIYTVQQQAWLRTENGLDQLPSFIILESESFFEPSSTYLFIDTPAKAQIGVYEIELEASWDDFETKSVTTFTLTVVGECEPSDFNY